MRDHWSSGVQRWLGLRVRRTGPDNRFEATRETLTALGRRGYAPRVVVDAGANRGVWTRMAAGIFPEAAFHLIEPQAACADALAAFRPPRFHVHACAVTRPDVRTVRMAGQTGDAGDTGAHVVAEDDPHATFTGLRPATTLDALLLDHVAPDGRALLKLDLEGHELEALSGAAGLLPRIEVLLTEVHFLEGAGPPGFGDVHEHLRARGFVLYDIAALASRPVDGRLRTGDVVFVRRDSALLADTRWA